MKKYIKNPLLTFILGFILSGSIVYAFVFYAQDVSYNNTNSNLVDENDNDVTNVQDAIDILYDKAINGYRSSKFPIETYTATVTNGWTKTINVDEEVSRITLWTVIVSDYSYTGPTVTGSVIESQETTHLSNNSISGVFCYRLSKVDIITNKTTGTISVTLKGPKQGKGSIVVVKE